MQGQCGHHRAILLAVLACKLEARLAASCRLGLPDGPRAWRLEVAWLQSLLQAQPCCQGGRILLQERCSMASASCSTGCEHSKDAASAQQHCLAACKGLPQELRYAEQASFCDENMQAAQRVHASTACSCT